MEALMNRLATLISLALVAMFVSIGTASHSMTLLVAVTVLIGVVALAHQSVRNGVAVAGSVRLSSGREFLACLVANTFRLGVAAVSIAWVVILVRSLTAA
jgi:hypothetical protein